MTWLNLQLCILEDLASSAALSLEAQKREVGAAEGFLRVRLNGNYSLVKRNRPEDLLEQLTELTATRPAGPWTAKELLSGLGWASSKGAPESIGMAMVELGWTKKRDWKTLGYPTFYMREDS